MRKCYKAIFFDWDGTAVTSRTASADQVIALMSGLLKKGIKLILVSGTTYENIANGELSERIDKNALCNLYLGLGRGAFNYGFDEVGNLKTSRGLGIKAGDTYTLHDICFDIHKFLLEKHNYETDIVFSRPNYCKIDLLVKSDRNGKLFLQTGEIAMVNQALMAKGYEKGIKGLIDYAGMVGKQKGLKIKATTDAKYLEVGLGTKSDNIDHLLEEAVFSAGIKIEECCFWGDEFTFLGEGVQGSDAYMITEKSLGGDFFDVSEAPLGLPDIVKSLGGGVDTFLSFLEDQLNCKEERMNGVLTMEGH